MPDCFIYDHVRTPRGRGKPDGALHDGHRARTCDPGAACHPRPQRARYAADRRRGARLRRSGRRSGRRHRRAPPSSMPAYDSDGGRHSDQPLLRIGARRDQFRGGRDHGRPARHGDRRRGRIDEPHRDWRLRRRMAGRSLDCAQELLSAPGHLRRSHRHQIRFFARRCRCLCGRKPEARARALLAERRIFSVPSCR